VEALVQLTQRRPVEIDHLDAGLRLGLHGHQASAFSQA
jgi:hypothetical protein